MDTTNAQSHTVTAFRVKVKSVAKVFVEHSLSYRDIPKDMT